MEAWRDRTRQMTGTPFSFARQGEIETANRVRRVRTRGRGEGGMETCIGEEREDGGEG